MKFLSRHWSKWWVGTDLNLNYSYCKELYSTVFNDNYFIIYISMSVSAWIKTRNVLNIWGHELCIGAPFKIYYNMHDIYANGELGYNQVNFTYMQ